MQSTRTTASRKLALVSPNCRRRLTRKIIEEEEVTELTIAIASLRAPATEVVAVVVAVASKMTRSGRNFMETQKVSQVLSELV